MPAMATATASTAAGSAAGAGVAADLMAAGVTAAGAAAGRPGRRAVPISTGRRRWPKIACWPPAAQPSRAACHPVAPCTGGRRHRGQGPRPGIPAGPGQSAPVYPPGQFSPWNQRPAGTRDGRAVAEPWRGAASAEHGYAEPGLFGPCRFRSGRRRDVHPDLGGGRRPPVGQLAGHAPRGRAGQAAGGRASSGARPPGRAPPRPSPSRRPAASAPGSPPARAARGAARGRRGRKAARAKRFRVLLATGLAVVVAAATGTYFYLAGGQRQAGQPAAAPRATSHGDAA